MIIKENQQNLINYSVPQSIIIEKEPTASVRAVSTNIVGLVCTCTRGKTDELIDVGSLEEFVAKCGDYSATHDGYLFARNYFSRGGGSLKIARAVTTGTAKAEISLGTGLNASGVVTGSAFDLEFDSVGTAGNNTVLKITNSVLTGYIDLLIQNGKQTKEYLTANLVTTDERYLVNLINQDQDRFFDIVNVTNNVLPLTGSYQMSGGSNGGTCTEDDYVGVETTSGRTALQLFKEDDEVIMVVSAKVGDTINTGLIAHVNDVTLTPRRTVITFSNGTSIASAVTKAQGLNDDKVKIVYPQVFVRNPFSRIDELTSLVPFSTALDSSMTYEQSASQKVVSPLILKVEKKLTPNEVAILTRNQINPVTSVKGSGIIFRSDYTTSKNPLLSQNSWRKAKDTISLALDGVNRFFLSQDIDQDLWKSISDSYESYLQIEWDNKRIGKSDGSKPFSVKIDIINNPSAVVQANEVIADVEVSLKGLSDKIKVYLRTGVDITIFNA